MQIGRHAMGTWLYTMQVLEFRDLPAGILENIALVLTEKVYPPKSVIYYQGNEVEDLFFIQKGHIKVMVQLHRREW